MAARRAGPSPAFAHAGRGPARALVTGSLAYDFIIDYPGEFKSKLAFGKGPRRTAVFAAAALRRSMGGCAGNIAYTLATLGAKPLLAAAVGSDGAAYLAHLRARGIATAAVRRYSRLLTAQAYIATDARENQIIFFFGGAMDFAGRISLARFAARAALAIVSPNGREAMLRHAAQLAQLRIPFILDPGQALGLFGRAELRQMLGQSTYAIFNRAELGEFIRLSGVSRKQIEAQVEALVVTDSLNGSEICARGERHAVAADMRGETVDPTGCGDAYRGALMHAMLQGRTWPDAGRFASRVAGIKALTRGGQEFAVRKRDLDGV